MINEQVLLKEVEMYDESYNSIQDLISKKNAEGVIGSVVVVPVADAIVAGPKVGGKIDYSATSISSVSITINEEAYAPISIDMSEQAQLSVNLVDTYVPAMVKAIRDFEDKKILALAASLTTSIGSYTVSGSKALALATRKRLDKNKAPLANRYWTVGSELYGDLLDIDAFISYEKTGNAAKLAMGLVGMIYGLEVKQDNNIEPVEQDIEVEGVTSTYETYNNVAFVPSAFAIARSVNREFFATRNHENDRYEGFVKSLFGVKIVNDKHAVLVKSGVIKA